MKASTTSAATLGIVGDIVLGAWIGSEMTQSREAVAPQPAISAEAPEQQPVVAKAAPAKPKRVTRVARAASGAAVTAPASEDAPKLVMTIPMSAPELHARMKPILARGTKMPLAVEGFSDASQFATLAHAARNTQVPFILLKHRVLTEGQSLEDAIRASRPDLDARVEALKAKGEARADILAVTMASSASN